jgi:hypothetical protein
MEQVNPVTDAKTPKANGFRKFMKKLAIGLFLVLVLYIGTKYLLGAVLVYSQGDRVGYVYKFSHKGYIFKTNEGILKTGFVNIGNTSTPNEEWAFSVDNDSVANLITSIDQRIAVKLYYKEYYTPLFFKGDTKYFVYKMELMPGK